MRTLIDASHTFSRKNQSTSSTSYDKRSGRPTTSFTWETVARSPLIRICTLRTCLVFRQRKGQLFPMVARLLYHKFAGLP